MRRSPPDTSRAPRLGEGHDADLIRLLPGLWDLDITLPPNSAEVDALVAAVRNLRTLRTLAVRKGAGTYLSQPAPRALLGALADAVYACPDMHTTTLAFPLSADPALTRLAAALSSAPALQTLRTPLPSTWSPAYVSVASNPVLARICLGEEAHTPTQRMPDRRLSSPSSPYPVSSMPHSPTYKRRAILPTALFLHAARPHARLVDLIKAGTYICPNVSGGAAAGGWRGRAATVGSAPQIRPLPSQGKHVYKSALPSLFLPHPSPPTGGPSSTLVRVLSTAVLVPPRPRRLKAQNGNGTTKETRRKKEKDPAAARTLPLSRTLIALILD
ncbi:hypothetical protein DFH06DRAFT_1422497 [Mycena polygramma]|nr:hypothetical protein DFH06DRAFT_1422497 [Mycena polygramma]